MHTEKECPYKFSVEETEDGYSIHVKGDKEQLKAKLEAIEAYKVFKEKARAAGFHHHHGDHCGGGLMSLLHKHVQAIHKLHNVEGEPKQAEPQQAE